MKLRNLFSITIFFVSLFCTSTLYAQPELPNLSGVSKEAINVISWTSQYDGIKSIAVQRSEDSVMNFKAIGYVQNLGRGSQGFIDGHPNPGANYYKLRISFASDLTWYSNIIRLDVDSLALAKSKVMPPNDQLQKYLTGGSVVSIPTNDKNSSAYRAKSTAADSSKGSEMVEIEVPDFNKISSYSYVKSNYVFTNPYNGHVNIELPNVTKNVYSIIFYTTTDELVLKLDKIPEPFVVLDKRNFQKKGVFKFDILKDNKKFESGYITIN